EPKKKEDTQTCTPTAQQLNNSGTVHYSFSEGGDSNVAQGAIISGTFTTEAGYSGTFSSTVVGATYGRPSGLSGTEGTGTSRSLATFSGPNINVAGTLLIVSITDNFLPDPFQHVGSTNAFSTPGLSVGLTRSSTTLR